MRTKITEAVDSYIRDHAHDMSQAEIADACGISKATVCRHLRRLELAGETVARGAPEPAERNRRDGDTGNDRLDRLVELRDRLYAAMQYAKAGELPRLSAEYRSVMDEIGKIERTEGSGADDAFDEIAAGFRAIARQA